MKPLFMLSRTYKTKPLAGFRFFHQFKVAPPPGKINITFKRKSTELLCWRFSKEFSRGGNLFIGRLKLCLPTSNSNALLLLDLIDLQ